MGKAVESKDFLRLEKGASWYDDAIQTKTQKGPLQFQSVSGID